MIFPYIICTSNQTIIANNEVQFFGSQLTPTFDKTVQSRFDLMPRLQFFGNAFAAKGGRKRKGVCQETL